MSGLPPRHAIAIGRSDHPEWTADEVLAWHRDVDGGWYSSQRHPLLCNGDWVVIRFVPGSAIVGLATIEDTNPVPVKPADRPEPDLCWRWPIWIRNLSPLAGLSLSDFGVTGARSGYQRLTAEQGARIAHCAFTGTRPYVGENA